MTVKRTKGQTRNLLWRDCIHWCSPWKNFRMNNQDRLVQCIQELSETSIQAYRLLADRSLHVLSIRLGASDQTNPSVKASAHLLCTNLECDTMENRCQLPHVPRREY